MIPFILRHCSMIFYGDHLDQNSSLSKPREAGISIIISLAVIVFIISFVADLMVTSQVNHRLTVNLQDSARAEYLANSAQNLAIFLLTIDRGVDLKTFEMAQIMPSDSRADIWGMLNDIAIGGDETETLKMIIEMFGLSEFMDRTLIRQLEGLIGHFRFIITDESARINLSHLQTSKMGTRAIQALERLLNCPSEQIFMDDKNQDPTELAYKAFDYIDLNKKVRNKSALSTENAPYDRLNPSYKAANRPLMSVNQLRLVDGWDREIHMVFSPFITVFPVPNKFNNQPRSEFGSMPFLNINTTSQELLQCLFPDMTPDCYNQFILTTTKNFEDNVTVASDASTISEALRNLVCYRPIDNEEDLTRWFRTTSSTYRIKAQGVTADTTYHKQIVIERLSPEYMKTNSVSSSWDMLYLRHGSSY